MLDKFIQQMNDNGFKVLSIQAEITSENHFDIILQSKKDIGILPSFFDNKITVDFKKKTIQTSLDVSLFLSLTGILNKHKLQKWHLQ